MPMTVPRTVLNVARFARSHDWWTWDHASIRDALQSARLVYMVDVIDQALESNRLARRKPGTWVELCETGRIRRDPQNLMKMKRGQHAFSDLVLLGIATALPIDLRRLSPTTDEWIIHATAELCGGRIVIADATHYWQYRLQTVGGPQRNGQHSHDVEAVERVIGLLEPKLLEIDRDIETRRSS